MARFIRIADGASVEAMQSDGKNLGHIVQMIGVPVNKIPTGHWVVKAKRDWSICSAEMFPVKYSPSHAV